MHSDVRTKIRVFVFFCLFVTLVVASFDLAELPRCLALNKVQLHHLLIDFHGFGPFLEEET